MFGCGRPGDRLLPPGTGRRFPNPARLRPDSRQPQRQRAEPPALSVRCQSHRCGGVESRAYRSFRADSVADQAGLYRPDFRAHGDPRAVRHHAQRFRLYSGARRCADQSQAKGKGTGAHRRAVYAGGCRRRAQTVPLGALSPEVSGRAVDQGTFQGCGPYPGFVHRGVVADRRERSAQTGFQR